MRHLSGRFRGRVCVLPACCAAVVVLLISSSCGQDQDSSSQPMPSTQSEAVSPAPPVLSSHARMLALLQRTAVQPLRDHPILGNRAARKLRRRLAELRPVQAPHVPSASTTSVYAQLGKAELRLGNLDRGIEHLTTVHQQQKQLSREGIVSPEATTEAAYRLGIAYMRLGETQNCCNSNSAESCLLPIRDGGIHSMQKGSKQALAYFTEVLQKVPKDSPLYMKSVWLLNIMYMTIDGYPDQVPPQYLIPPNLFEAEEPFPKFENVAAKLGLDTFDLLGSAVVDDFAGDGYLDIVVSTWDPNQQMHFFRNNRDGTFSDRSEQANLVGLVGGFNMVQADYDNDGDVDIFVLRGGWTRQFGRIPNSLLRNEGDARAIIRRCGNKQDGDLTLPL